MSEQKSVLILLIGSNPLPNYLSAYMLRPEKVVLVYSSQTKDVKERLEEVLNERDDVHFELTSERVADASSARDVAEIIENIFNSNRGCRVCLNYTGGTKVMAAHARMAFGDQGGEDADASYLDEGRGENPRLRFDDGTSRLLDTELAPLDMETLLALHGITFKPRTSYACAPTSDDALHILDYVLEDVTRAKYLYDEYDLEKHKKPIIADKPPFEWPKELVLSVRCPPTRESMSKDPFNKWSKFICGEWLEEWLADQIRSLSPQGMTTIVAGLNATREKRPFELDVALLLGHRSYFISCTTDTKDLCKSKLFEIAIRSRQLGGDMARGALVCLADKGKVDALKQDIDDMWGASNTICVFGIEDVRAWRKGNFDELTEWLGR